MKKDEKGEAVFNSVDGVLSDKIIGHTQGDANEKQESPDQSADFSDNESDSKNDCCEPTKKNSKLILIILAGVVGVALILYGFRRFHSSGNSWCRR